MPKFEQPPAIVIAWSQHEKRWLATAIQLDHAPIGATTIDGGTTAAALNSLLDFALTVGADFRPTAATLTLQSAG